MTTTWTAKELKELFAKNPEDFFDKLKSFPDEKKIDELLIIEKDWRALNRKVRNGEIDHQEKSIVENQITARLFQTIDFLFSGVKPYMREKMANENHLAKNKLSWYWVGLIILLIGLASGYTIKGMIDSDPNEENPAILNESFYTLKFVPASGDKIEWGSDPLIKISSKTDTIIKEIRDDRVRFTSFGRKLGKVKLELKDQKNLKIQTEQIHLHPDSIFSIHVEKLSSYSSVDITRQPTKPVAPSTITISGQVKDKNGKKITGVEVWIKEFGYTYYSKSNLDGRYSLKIPKEKALKYKGFIVELMVLYRGTEVSVTQFEMEDFDQSQSISL